MIVRAFKQLFSSSDLESQAHDAYLALVAQSRKRWFYQNQGVADTLDGRFDVVVLHMFLLIHRLRRENTEEAAYFIRAISEVFFSDMDRSLREMGSSDTGVGMRVKKMAQAFYGRLQAYEQGFSTTEGLKDSLKRNLYRGEEVSPERLDFMADYVRRNAAHLATQKNSGITSGNITFLD